MQLNPNDQPQGELRSSTVFAVALIIFLAVHFLLSLALSGSFSPDDADQLIFSQTLERGYYEQPPLYSWLSYLFLHLFGLSFVSYYLLKSLALGCIYLATFLCARLLAIDHRAIVPAAFSPLLIPTFGWHSFSYLTNTNLTCAAVAAACYLLIRLQRHGYTRDYLLLGLTVGIGLLSKYNFLLMAGALFAAGLTIPSFRAKILDYRMFFALGIAVLLVLPNAVWLFEHRTALIPVLNHKLEVNQGGRLPGRLHGLFSLLSNVLLILLPAAVIFLLFRRQAASLNPLSDAHRFLARFFLAALGLLLLLVLIGGATHFHERWLQPFVLLVPLFVLSRYRFQSRRAFLGFTVILFGSALAYAAVRGGQVFAGGFDRGTYPLQMNFSPAADQLRPFIDERTVVISRDREICGNLRYQLPSARHLCSSHPLYLPSLDKFNGARILVWNTVNGNTPPPDLRTFVAQTLGLQVPESAAVHFVNVPPKLAGRRVNRLGYTLVSR